jgi:hypothetical protein
VAVVNLRPMAQTLENLFRPDRENEDFDIRITLTHSYTITSYIGLA